MLALDADSRFAVKILSAALSWEVLKPGSGAGLSRRSTWCCAPQARTSAPCAASWSRACCSPAQAAAACVACPTGVFQAAIPLVCTVFILSAVQGTSALCLLFDKC